MQGRVNVGGTWKMLVPYLKVSSAWKKPKEGWVKVDGVWRQWWKAETTFSYTGSLQTYVVPEGITSLDVDMAGGSGGGGSNTVPGGGRGGHRLQATISVSPGQTLYIAVGGGGIGRFSCYPCPECYGSRPGGWPGGGYSGQPSWWTQSCFLVGGSGGGYSAILSANSLTQANMILLAGGGGGVSAGWTPNYNGKNGTLTAGGARGYSDGFNFHTAGSALQGGTGDGNNNTTGFEFPGGGGGGGYFGGGGGGAGDSSQAGSGGDGSSWTKAGVTNIVHTNNYRDGNGYVTLMI